MYIPPDSPSSAELRGKTEAVLDADKNIIRFDNLKFTDWVYYTNIWADVKGYHNNIIKSDMIYSLNIVPTGKE